ncbi:esterase [Clavibacter michiganensis]|uniref:alpha/beta hydrolase n=1 Tax=Clavibacter michiganensis TaxID=28447 RepID=UPI000CE75A85|nr:alpha/beta hydrolase-fold protein [Clavibacter michiganensis]PPF91297.1 esterase [Clavibacter michiganensis]PPF99339.1 esterase [Clavibacter michiganensis]
MRHLLGEMSVISPSFVTAATLAPLFVAVLLAVIARRARLSRGARVRDPRRTVLHLALGAILGGAAGLLLGWLFSDVLVVLGFGLTTVTKAWTAVGMMELGAAVVVIVRSRRSITGIGGRAAPAPGLRVLHRSLGVALVPLAVFSGAVGINSDVEEYPNVAAAFGLIRVSPLDVATVPAPTASTAGAATDLPVEGSWTAEAAQPQRGRTGSVSIPGTQSAFRARDAIVYLPPAALMPDAPALPVIVALAGQPGEPLDLLKSARIDRILDEYAAAHQGLAPIVVIPDQLGAPAANPMCVDSPLGNSASYLTEDVPTWIRQNLRVLPGPAHWAVAGFSQGGTCAAQLGTARPDVFGALLDISGEIGPHAARAKIDTAFGGDRDAYKAAFPASIMAAKAPYSDSAAYFCVGDQDQKFRPHAEALDAAAREAGIDSHLHLSERSAHDWRTVRNCVQSVLPVLSQRLGVTG